MAASPDASTAQFVTHGDHRIHYTTFASTLIPPDVAQAHNIIRAENKLVINISVVKDRQPAAVALEGRVTNLLDQMSKLTFNEIRERGAIYYLAQHTAIEKDILRFAILVRFHDKDLVPYALTFIRSYD